MDRADTEAEARRRRELGRFLRHRRERVRPDQLGIAVRRRRRAPGLLREEVAEIAGVSVTWYTWLEQARATNPSARVLEGLASALCLAPAERSHLYRLARPDLEPSAPRGPSEQLSPTLEALLHGLAPHPAYAINARWDVLAWNQPAAIVFDGFAQLAAGERNIMHRLLFDPGWRRLFAAWESIVESAVAQFRASTVHLAADPELAGFLSRMAAGSPRFARLWKRQEVALPPTCVKTIDHPRAGAMTLNYATLRPDSDTEDVRFTIYTPADALSGERLRQLLADEVGASRRRLRPGQRRAQSADRNATRSASSTGVKATPSDSS